MFLFVSDTEKYLGNFMEIEEIDAEHCDGKM